MKTASSSLFLILLLALSGAAIMRNVPVAHAMAADAPLATSGENYVGVRYKALLAEDELSETGWVLLFGGSGFTRDGEYEPHFIDLMIKGGSAHIYDDPLCGTGFPPLRDFKHNFSIQFGLSDYEDGSFQDNDIAVWSEHSDLLPRMFTNIDSTEPQAADKIMVDFQLDRASTLEGREVEVSFVRGEVTKLSQNQNYFMDPDNGCAPNSQADIPYRHWVATLKVPSLGVDSYVDFYVNAEQGDKILGANTLNFMWESPGPNPPAVRTDKFRVIIFDPEVEMVDGVWKKATRFLVDYRTPWNELPLNDMGQLVGGYRRVNYKGQPAIEASFGYGYTDYVVDGDPTNYEPTDATKAVIDLSYSPAPVHAVVRGNDNRVYHGGNLASYWLGWSVLPGSTPDSPAAAVCEGVLHIVVRGIDNGIYYTNVTLSSNAFAGWTRVPGATLSAPGLAAASKCRLYLAVRGMDNRIYLSIGARGSWGTWQKLPGGTVDGPAVAVADSILHLAVRGLDGSSIWHGRLNRDTMTWIGWLRVSGSTASKPALAVVSDTEVYLAVRGTDNRIYMNQWNGAAWCGWGRVPTGSTLNGPSIAVANGQLYVAVQGGGNGIYWCGRSLPSGSWSGWSKLPGATPSSPTLA